MYLLFVCLKRIEENHLRYSNLVWLIVRLIFLGYKFYDDNEGGESKPKYIGLSDFNIYNNDKLDTRCKRDMAVVGKNSKHLIFITKWWITNRKLEYTLLQNKAFRRILGYMQYTLVGT